MRMFRGNYLVSDGPECYTGASSSHNACFEQNAPNSENAVNQEQFQQCQIQQFRTLLDATRTSTSRLDFLSKVMDVASRIFVEGDDAEGRGDMYVEETPESNIPVRAQLPIGKIDDRSEAGGQSEVSQAPLVLPGTSLQLPSSHRKQPAVRGEEAFTQPQRASRHPRGVFQSIASSASRSRASSESLRLLSEFRMQLQRSGHLPMDEPAPSEEPEDVWTQRSPESDSYTANVSHPAQCHEIADADCDASEDDGLEESWLPSYGSSGHSIGACKPCLFWYRGLCVKGERCQYCHIQHAVADVKKIKPSKNTRSLMRQRFDHSKR